MDNLNFPQANNKTGPMRIQKKLMRIMARTGMIVGNKHILVEKQMYTKGSTPENKISIKTTFVCKYTKMY